MSYEIRRTAKNKYQLRESPSTRKRSKQEFSPEILRAQRLPPVEPPILGEFESEEAAAHFALQHEKGDYDWHPFDPQRELDQRRAQLEGNLRS